MHSKWPRLSCLQGMWLDCNGVGGSGATAPALRGRQIDPFDGRGRVQQARELLALVYGWFTEGFDPRDLKDSKALLEELAS
jgi:hypothetical protein